MIIIRLISRYYACLLYSWVFLGVNSSNSGRYQEAIVGEHTELECSFDRDVDTLTWTHVPTGSDDIHSVFVGQYPSGRYADRFSLNVVTSGKYNLLIKDVQKQDAGNFTCREQEHQEDDVSQFVALTVLETQPICRSTIISRHSSSCVDTENLRLLCAVKYVGDFPPTLIWKNVSNKNYNNSVMDGKNGVHNSIEVTTDWNQFMFVCETVSSQRPCYIIARKPDHAFETLTTKTINGPQKVTCIANSSQVCTYQWFLKDDDKILHAGQELELTSELSSGVYICKAECHFHGVNCILRSLLIEYNNGNQSKYPLYICASIVSVLAAILLIITIHCLYRARISRRTASNNGTTLINETTLFTDISLPLMQDQEEATDNIHPDLQPANPEYFERIYNIQMEPDGTASNIKGLAIFEDKIYIARFSKKYIDTYDKVTRKRKNRIVIGALEQARDLAISPRSKCLYISDAARVIHSVVLGCNTFGSWPTTDIPEGISITNTGDILVSFPYAHRIIIYSKNESGEELRNIQMPDQFTYLRQTIQLDENSFLVCYGGLGNIQDESETHHETNGVVVFDENKKEQKECEYFSEGTTIARPLRMAVTETGHIFVATYHGKEVVLLNRELNHVSTLLSVRDNNINRMCYDEMNRCLYIADHGEAGTIHICKLNRRHFDKVFNFMGNQQIN